MSDQERETREEALRRLLAQAVEPVNPAPGAQTRLLVRARAQRRRTRRRPARLGWAAAGLTTVLVVMATVIFAGRTGGRSGSPATVNAGGAPSGAASAPLRPVGPASRPAPGGQKDAATSGAGSAVNPNAAPAPLNDLDGDGLPDVLTLAGRTLTAQLSRDGRQTVTLPATGPGARALGLVLLDSSTGVKVAVAFVRLQERPGFLQDTAVTVVNGRLRVLRLGAGPVLLRVDATHGYSCDTELAVAGNPSAYLIRGNLLVASPRLRAVFAAVGQVTGCGGG